MNAPSARLHPSLDAALLRVCTAVEQCTATAAERLSQAMADSTGAQREAQAAAQQALSLQGKLLARQFLDRWRQAILSPAAPKAATVGGTDWGELSLMDDAQVDALMSTNRIGMALSAQAEWELREVERYLPSLLPPGLAGDPKHPLRPESVAKALHEASEALNLKDAARQALLEALSSALGQDMKSCYADMAELFRSRGLQAQDLKVLGTATPAGRSAGIGAATGSAVSSGTGSGGRFSGQGAGSGGAATSGDAADEWDGASADDSRSDGFADGRQQAQVAGPSGGRRSSLGRGSVIGQVGAGLMELLRRLAQMPPGDAGASLGGLSTQQHSQFSSALPSWQGDDASSTEATARPGAPLQNLITTHRDALRQASTGQLDHLVIDVVGSLFDQILADPRVPPQMARQLARLQLPVLRVALGDASFFSQRSHPVRRFVNRLASLACAYEDFSEDPGRAFLHKVRELVQDLVQSDFDRMDVYEQQLAALEAFVAEQTAAALKSQGDVAAVADHQERLLKQQQAFARQLEKSLEAQPMPDFLREFLLRTWSQAIIRAGDGKTSVAGQATAYRQAAKDLVLSVQPKGLPAQRQAFLASLPGLMRALNEGLDLIRWPESARKAFFGQLLPAHAESLKGQGLTPLAYNLLSRELDRIFGLQALPDLNAPDQDEANEEASTLPADLDVAEHVGSEAASQLGLLAEHKVDWSAAVDIDLSAEPAVAATDISLDGLPQAEAPEPTQGAELLEHLQLGFAYRMHTGKTWQKVRLSHISAGRSFFIFSHGHKHQETLTMTARMVRRLCEAGRLRAFENAYLLERATARARKQLAELSKLG